MNKKMTISLYVLGVVAILLIGIVFSRRDRLPDYLKSAVFSSSRVEGVVSGSSLAQGEHEITFSARTKTGQTVEEIVPVNIEQTTVSPSPEASSPTPDTGNSFVSERSSARILADGSYMIDDSDLQFSTSGQGWEEVRKGQMYDFIEREMMANAIGDSIHKIQRYYDDEGPAHAEWAFGRVAVGEYNISVNVAGCDAAVESEYVVFVNDVERKSVKHKNVYDCGSEYDDNGRLIVKDSWQQLGYIVQVASGDSVKVRVKAPDNREKLNVDAVKLRPTLQKAVVVHWIEKYDAGDAFKVIYDNYGYDEYGLGRFNKPGAFVNGRPQFYYRVSQSLNGDRTAYIGEPNWETVWIEYDKLSVDFEEVIDDSDEEGRFLVTDYGFAVEGGRNLVRLDTAIDPFLRLEGGLRGTFTRMAHGRAVWHWMNVVPGKYDLYATWGEDPELNRNVVYKTSLSDEFTVNQSRQPNGDPWGSVRWQKIGMVDVPEGLSTFTVYIELPYVDTSDPNKTPNRPVYLDAMRLAVAGTDFHEEKPPTPFDCSPGTQVVKSGSKATVKVSDGYDVAEWSAKLRVVVDNGVYNVGNEADNKKREFTGVFNEGVYQVSATRDSIYRITGIDEMYGGMTDVVKGPAVCTVVATDDTTAGSYEVVDDADSVAKFTVVYAETKDDPTGLFGKQKVLNSGDAANAYHKSHVEWRWSSLSPGDYYLYATWAKPSFLQEGLRQHMMTTVRYNGFEVDQRLDPTGSVWGGRPWEALGVVSIKDGESSYAVRQELPTWSNQVFVSIDAMRLIPAGKDFFEDDPGEFKPMDSVIADYGWEDPSAHGIWRRPNAYGNGVIGPMMGTGHNNSYFNCSASYCDDMQWQFKNMPEGKYDVYATWVAPAPNNTSREFKVEFSVGEGGDAKVVNTNVFPSGPTYSGVQWQSIGSVQFAGDLNVGVRVMDGTARLDAVMLVPEGFEFESVGGSEINLDMGSETVEIDAVDVGASTGVNLLDMSSDDDASVGAGFWTQILKTMVWWK